MKNTIKWVHILTSSFKKLDPANLLIFCTGIKNQLTIDLDVLVAGSPISMAVYQQQWQDVSDILVMLNNTSAKTLTTDQHTKVSTLINSTESIAHYVETSANNKFPGVEDKITTIINRIGYDVRQSGTHGTRIFEVVETGVQFITLRTPAGDNAAAYIFQYSPNPADPAAWSKYIVWPKTQVTITGLQSGINYGFRYALVASVKGTTSIAANNLEPIWSDTITSVVL